MAAMSGNELGEMARAWQRGDIPHEEYFDWEWAHERARGAEEVRIRLAAIEAQHRAEARAELINLGHQVVNFFLLRRHE